MAWRGDPSPEFTPSRTAPRKQEDSSQKHTYCANCGKTGESFYKFCPECGSKWVELVRPSNQCACGTVLNGACNFCPNCGKQKKK